MREKEVEYLHLPSGSELPELASKPSRVVVLVEQEVAREWQDKVSDWIVDSGCLYMMAWGVECSSWNDSVDWAALRKHDFAEISDDDFVMTTWHSDEPMSEAFWYCQFCAIHPTIDLDVVRLVHIAADDNRGEILKAYASAKTDSELEDNDRETKVGFFGWLKQLGKGQA